MQLSATYGSFRDPQGRLVRAGNRIFRMLNPEGAESLRHVLASSALSPFLNGRSIVSTRFLPPDEAAAILSDPETAGLLRDFDCSAIVEHEPAPFANYPHEWPPEMLHAAGLLTVRLARSLLPEGIGLKDATPANVMFWGSRPVFLDLPSFERRDPLDPTWLPYAQFVRAFLLPLVANRQRAIPLARLFHNSPEGLDPEEVYALLGPLDRLRPRFFPLVTFPSWFAKSADSERVYRPRRLKNAEQAQFVLSRMLASQDRVLQHLLPPERDSEWSGYADANAYSAAQMDLKENFVRRFLEESQPASVLDIGSNTGRFSVMAAAHGSRVVAIDSDPAVVGRLWRDAADRNAAILPLVVDIGRPTPAVGWNNAECRSFLDRAAGAFDAVFMLALIHHLVVTARIPLAEIFDLARRLTTRWLVVEYVGQSDPMFVRLARGRAHLHGGHTRAAFDALAGTSFRIVRTADIPGADRALYLLEARP